MKKLITSMLVLAFLANSSPLFAHVGGPYSNNTHDGFQGGVFQGVMRMKNGSGMFRFSTGQEPIISPFAQSVVFHKGLVYSGDCFGMVDYVVKRVSGGTNGTTTGVAVPTPDGAIDNGAANFVFNTNWSGKITSTAPSVRFKFKGFGYQFSGTDTTTVVTTTTSFQEVVIPDDFPITIQTVIVTTNTKTLPPETVARVKVSGYGGRVSPIAFTTFSTAAPNP